MVAGAADIITPVAEMEAMARRIPQATFVALPDAGHLSNLEAPTHFNAALRDFLEGLA